MARMYERNSQLILCALSLAAGFFFLSYFAISLSTFFASEGAETVEQFRELEVRNGIVFGAICSFALGCVAYGTLRWFDRQERRAATLDDQLKGAERRLATSSLVHTVIHDTNNLLGVVRSGLTMLKDPGIPINQSALCDRMGTAVDRVEELHKQLLQRERAMHDQTVSKERFRVAEAFEELRIYARLHPRLKECRLDFRGGKQLLLNANRTEFCQAILNLVLNAADATENRGHVHAEASLKRGLVYITIDDDGPGVPADMREKIFGAFFTGKKHGTGLGLMSVKGFCDRSGGRIAIDESPMGGARFFLELPLAPNVDDKPIDVIPATAPLRA